MVYFIVAKLRILKRGSWNIILGKNKYTRNKGPWELLYFEACMTRSLAIKRERFFKTGKGRDYIRERITVGA